MAETAEESTLGVWSQLWEGAETPLDAIKQQLLAVYTALFQAEPLM